MTLSVNILIRIRLELQYGTVADLIHIYYNILSLHAVDIIIIIIIITIDRFKQTKHQINGIKLNSLTHKSNSKNNNKKQKNKE